VVGEPGTEVAAAAAASSAEMAVVTAVAGTAEVVP
jgi:hypothetical protein